MSMNPFDEIAVEEAIRLKEAGKGPRSWSCRSVRRRPPRDAPHRACHGRRPRHPRKSDEAGRAARRRQDLKGVVEAEQPGLVILGKQAIDDDSTRPARCWRRCSAGPRAHSPPRSCSATNANGDARGRRRPADGGSQAAAVVTTDLRLNEPRYASLPNIMKAKKKPIDKKRPPITASTAPRLTVVKTTSRGPQGRRQGRIEQYVTERVAAEAPPPQSGKY